MAISLRSKVQEFLDRSKPLKQARARLGRRLTSSVPTDAVAYAFAALRIGVGGVLLLQAALIAPVFLAMYGEAGLVQGSLAERIANPMLPSFFSLGVSSDALRVGFGLLYVAAVLAMTLGWHARLATPLTWMLHLMLTNSGPTHNYGVDQLAKVALFYLVWAPSANVWAIDSWRGLRLRPCGDGSSVLLFVMRMQLAVVYLASGIEKAMGEQWHNGEAIWRSLMLPIFRQVDWSWLASMPWLAQLIGIGTLVIEIGYIVFIWPARTRLLWLALTIGMHLGIWAFMGLHLFALLMIVLNIALFAPLSRVGVAVRSVDARPVTCTPAAG